VRFVVSAVGEDGLGAAALDLRELRERHALREHDGRGSADELRGERETIRTRVSDMLDQLEHLNL